MGKIRPNWNNDCHKSRAVARSLARGKESAGHPLLRSNSFAFNL